MKKSFIKVAITSISNFIFGIYQWLLLVLFIHLGTVTEVGTYTYALSITAPLIMLITLKYETYIQTNNIDLELGKVLFTIRITLIAISTFIILPIIKYIAGNDQYMFWIILSVWFYKSVEVFLQMGYSHLINLGELKELNISKIRRALFSLLIAITSFVNTKNVAITIILISIYLIIEVIIFQIRYSKYSIVKLNKTIIKQYFVFFIPFGLSLFLVSINANISRLFGERFFGLEFVAKFSSIIYFITIGNMVMNSIFSVAAPKLRRLLDKDNREFSRLYLLIGFFIVIIGLVSILIANSLGEEILSIVYGELFTTSNELTLVMVIGSFLYLSSYFQFILTFLGKLNIQFIMVFIGLIVQLISILLLKDIGEISIYLSYLSSVIITSVALFCYITLILRNKENDLK